MVSTGNNLARPNLLVSSKKLPKGNAFSGWSGASAYLRGQILYRIAEMLEGRSDQFVAELKLQGVSKRRADGGSDG